MKKEQECGIRTPLAPLPSRPSCCPQKIKTLRQLVNKKQTRLQGAWILKDHFTTPNMAWLPVIIIITYQWEVWCSHGQCNLLPRSKRSRFEPWPGTLCCFLGQDSSLSQYLSPPNKWVTTNLMLGGNPAMDQHPILGGLEILLVTSYYRKRDKLRPDEPQLACMQTLPYLTGWQLSDGKHYPPLLLIF